MQSTYVNYIELCVQAFALKQITLNYVKTVEHLGKGHLTITGTLAARRQTKCVLFQHGSGKSVHRLIVNFLFSE